MGMEEFPFAEATSYMSHAQWELIPYALQEWFDRDRQPTSRDARAAERLLERVRGWEIDDQLRVWLRTRASLRSYRALHLAFESTRHFLLSSQTTDTRARQLAAEMLACQTLLNAARLALRGPVNG